MRRSLSLHTAAAMVAVMFMSMPASASEPTSADKWPSYGIQIDPLTPIVGAVIGFVAAEVEFQVAFSDYVGLSVIPAFVWTKLTVSGEEVGGYGFSIRAGPRFFPQGRRLDGAYVLPFVDFAYASASSDTSSAEVSILGLGAEAGYSWTWSNGFSINLGGGLSYGFYLKGTKPDRVPISPVLNFTLGYVW